MGQYDDGDKDFPANDSINSLLDINQFTCTPLPPHGFDVTAASQNDFLDQMFSSVPPSTSFPFVDNYEPPVPNSEDQKPSVSPVDAKAMLLQQQFQLAAAGNVPLCQVDQNDVVDGLISFPYPIPTIDSSAKALYNGFEEFLPQNSIQSLHFNQPQNYGSPAASMPISQPQAIGSSSGATAAKPQQRVRARRGQATDPHSIAERLRRERIAERMKALQELVPNVNKMDKATMLDEIIDYVKFLQLQVKQVLSVSRLGGGAAAAIAPSILDFANEARGDNGATSVQDNDAITVTEQQVAKLMEEDMGAAMQYLQGKGLCLMPISLATIISTSQRCSNGRAARSSSTVGDVSTVEDAAD